MPRSTDSTQSLLKNIDRSKVDSTSRLMGKAQKLLAYGGLDGVVQRPLFDGDGGVFPHFAVHAEGCRFTDSTGQTFIDLVNGWGPVLLGYRHPAVERAITEQFHAGPTLSLMNPVEIEVAGIINEMMPCAEMVAFGKNGSDAVAAALRIARATTGRNMILQFGFHGFHDWYACLHPTVHGIPEVLREHVRSFEYNDMEGLRQLFDQYADQVAAVIMEPVNLWMPEPGYLEAVRELTHERGALLIYDEIVTSFRVARGGAQELFGVIPDLACLGKGMANGMPLSAVVGKRNYMQILKRCGFGLTFRGETLSLAAARATLEIIRDEPIIDRLDKTGAAIRDGFHQLCRQHNVGCQLTGPAARMTFVFDANIGKMTHEEARVFFIQDVLRNGVLTNGNILVNAAMDDAAIAEVLEAFDKSLKRLARYSSGDEQPADVKTGGSMFGIRALQASGFLDQLREDNGSVIISGWILLDDSAPDEFQLQSADGDCVTAEVVLRPGLKKAFPNHRSAERAGFRIKIPVDVIEANDQFRFSIVAKQAGLERYSCRVEYQKDQTFAGPYSINSGVLYI